MKKSVVVSERQTGQVEVDIPAIPDWEGFDKLCQFLINEYSAAIVSSVDGPGVRKCILHVKGQSIELRYEEPYGSSIHSIESNATEIIRIIGKDLADRLKET